VSELPVSLKIKQLEKENARLKKDNEILKKTIRLLGKNE
jgi:cell division protein FtsB